MDPATVIDCLEKNSRFDNYMSHALYNNKFVDVTNMLDFVSSWLNTECRRELGKCDMTQIEVSRNKLLQVRDNLTRLINDLRKMIKAQRQNQVSTYKFICNVCDTNIFDEDVVAGTKEFWSSLQEHNHIEEQYVAYLENRSSIQPSSSKTSLTLQHKNVVVFNGDSNTVKENGLYLNTKGTGKIVKQNDLSKSTNRTQPDNSFRFNFQVNYDNCIEKILYPPDLSRKIRAHDRVPDYTVQCSSITSICCLLCNCELPYTADTKIPSNATKNIILHVSGQKHMKLTESVDALIALNMYHKNWIRLEVPFQAHQIYFRPENVLETHCYLCNSVVLYKDLMAHILSPRHKTPLFVVWDYAEGKESLNFISCKQAEVYGRIIRSNSTKSTESENDSDTSVSTNHKTTPEENVSVTDSASSPVKSAANNTKTEHDIIVSVMKPTSDNVLELLEHRFKNHLKSLNVENNLVVCNGCNVIFKADLKLLRCHILLKVHCDACGVFNKKYSYHCEICNVFFRVENKWQEHLDFLGHKTKCQNLGKSRREKLNEFECKNCRFIIFGDELSLTRHRMSYRKKAAKKEIKLPENVKMLFKSEAHMVLVLADLVGEANFVLTASTQDVFVCCRALETALSDIYENCRAYPFGSRVSGLGNKNSDLDVFVDVGDMYTGQKCQDPASQEEFVKKCSKVFRRAKNNMFSCINPIPTARTPIIQVFHKPTELDCDLSFRHGLSVENTKFLKLCIQMQPATRSLILLLKKWSAYCKLNEHITTYALSMMVIFFMQVHGHLLSVAILRKLNPLPSVVIAGWETINYVVPVELLKLQVKPYENSVKLGLKEFFVFYTNFKYATDVICPLLGRCITKSAFVKATGEDLPIEMFTYVKKLQNDPEPEHFRMASPLCIQDPFDLSHNLTKACQPGTLEKFKKLCELTLKHLSSVN